MTKDMMIKAKTADIVINAMRKEKAELKAENANSYREGFMDGQDYSFRTNEVLRTKNERLRKAIEDIRLVIIKECPYERAMNHQCTNDKIFKILGEASLSKEEGLRKAIEEVLRIVKDDWELCGIVTPILPIKDILKKALEPKEGK